MGKKQFWSTDSRFGTLVACMTRTCTHTLTCLNDILFCPENFFKIPEQFQKKLVAFFNTTDPRTRRFVVCHN